MESDSLASDSLALNSLASDSLASDSFDALIQRLKTCVQKMLLQRSQLEASGTTNPAPIWTEALSVFSYLMNLSSQDFRNIRFHTELITGELIGTYWAPEPPHIPEEFANGLGMADLFNHLPPEYWIGEPAAPGLPRLGVPYRGVTLNRNIARYQIAIANLYYGGVLQRLRDATQKQYVLEIGAGYGGLAHHLGRLLATKVTYLIVDLPEMFMFQAPYLAINAPDASIYIYDPASFTPDFILNQLPQFDFALIPNFALQQLEALPAIALMLNMQSFQEMTGSQVREYLEFGAKRITDCLYSDNVDRHPHNPADLESVTALLEEFFDLYPSNRYYDDLFHHTDWRWSRYYRKFLATPKGSLPIHNTQMITMHHADPNGKLQRLQEL